jgi:hypothetical protein
MRYDRIVMAYHGCDALVAEDILGGQLFRASENDYDWLGRGVYFWEFGPARAMDFARSKKYDKPAVIGAPIQLGNCFDLMDVRHTQELALGYKALAALGMPLPKNCGADGKARFLDCAVVNYTLQVAQKANRPYDSVRAAFIEGKPVYPGGEIYEQSHIQICVRNPACIIGVFRPTF